MTTRLTRPIRREIEIDGEPFTVEISPAGVRLMRKRFRSGRGLSWRALWYGDSEHGPESRRSEPSGSPDPNA
jgi:hypothetical protein